MATETPLTLNTKFVAIVSKPGKPELFLGSSAGETYAKFSPDGRWIAYRSNESGENQVYVRPFPASSSGRWQVSVVGGNSPFWSNNGRELFYITADQRIMVVDYAASGGSFVLGRLRPWFNQQLFDPGVSSTVYVDLAPDRKHFVVPYKPESEGGEKGSVHVTMLLNFFDEIKRRIP